LADILPTAYEVGVLNGMVSPGDVVAIVGAGPIGLAAILAARLYTPGRIVAIDLADSRLESAVLSAPTRRSTTVVRTHARRS
jgi:alcohol dehydrogenase